MICSAKLAVASGRSARDARAQRVYGGALAPPHSPPLTGAGTGDPFHPDMC